MNPEPKWPTVDAVADAAGKAGDPPWLSDTREVALAIKLCREAWRASVDDPSASVVGEVRRSPDGIPFYRLDDFDTTAAWGAALAPDGKWCRTHDEVRGWPVIGAVPGTPAAEAQQ